jgi:predicted ferric reductase
MSKEDLELNEFQSMPTMIRYENLLIILMAVFLGTTIATIVVPAWLPDFVRTVLGPDPKVFWFLSRGSAIAGYCLLWFSMVMGLLMTNKMARAWPGGPTAYDLHQFVSLLGLGVVLFHGLILIGDRYASFNLLTVLLPFANPKYKPTWVGLGQLSFYFWGIIVFSFYIRKRIGITVWRLVHLSSFVAFLTGLIHGVMSGTDTSSLWATVLYWSSGGVLLFFSIYRLLSRLIPLYIKEPSA